MSEKKKVMTAQDSKGGDFERQHLEAGNYRARIYAIVDKGTHDKIFKGKVDGTERRLRISFELCDELRVFKEGSAPQPMAIHWDIKNSNDDRSKLMKMVAQLDKKFDIKDSKQRRNYNVFDLIGKPCMVTIDARANKNDSSIIYNNVTGITPPMKDDDRNFKPLVNKSYCFYIPANKKDLDDWMEDLMLIHPKTRQTIYESPEWRGIMDQDDTKELEQKLEDMYANEFGSSGSSEQYEHEGDDEWA